jgi:glutamate-1-semialdehyde aminotransferase
VVGPGGLTALWDLEPDIVTAGKSIAGGVLFGAWGMTDEIADVLEQAAPQPAPAKAGYFGLERRRSAGPGPSL